jgi:hypothetical protein
VSRSGRLRLDPGATRGYRASTSHDPRVGGRPRSGRSPPLQRQRSGASRSELRPPCDSDLWAHGPDWFRPWGDIHHLVIRDICPLRPCFDYCRFPEPYCLTRLPPQEAWPEIDAHIRQLISRGVLPRELQRNPEIADVPRAAVQTAGVVSERARPAGSLDIAFSVADQNVATTKSIGIYNFSLHLARHLATRRR